MFITFAIFLGIHAQTNNYYVSAESGVDSSSCGAKEAPCASINQVLTNYPGISCTVSVGPGVYATSSITLQRDAYVIIQGEGSPSIIASWYGGQFITTTTTSSVEFHDILITLSGTGDNFLFLNSPTNTAGFYNIALTYRNYDGNFVETDGGTIVINNVTLDGISSDSYFVADSTNQNAGSMQLVGSTFTNIILAEDGALLFYHSYGSVNLIIDQTVCTNITADYVFLGVWVKGGSANISITNSIFTNTNSYLAFLYIENDNLCTLFVQNTTWNNVTSGYMAGALEVLGPGHGIDEDFTFDKLNCTNCTSPISGALLIAYNSLLLSNSVFANNNGTVANDVVQAIPGNDPTLFSYSVTASYSSSSLLKAVVWDIRSNTVIEDISDLLPNPSS